MRRALFFLFSALAVSLIAATVMGATLTQGPAHPLSATVQGQSDSQTVSGKIASMAKNSFTLTVGSDVAAEAESADSHPAPSAMAFETDKNTTIEGEMKVGAHADVTYRVENGKNLALSIRVKS